MSEKETTPASSKKLCCSVNPFAKGLCRDCYANAVGIEVVEAVEQITRVLLSIHKTEEAAEFRKLLDDAL